MRTGRPRATHCKHGHEIALVGRYASGACRGCLRKLPTDGSRDVRRAGFCKQGHDLTDNRVMHGGKARGCLTCHRDRETARRAARVERARKAQQQRVRAGLSRSCVPTAPLLALLDRRGVALKGVGALVGERLGVKPSAVERLLHRAIGIGAFTVVAADEICVGLDVHPAEVWGAEWFTYGLEVADAV